jgi:hypothetical protein
MEYSGRYGTPNSIRSLKYVNFAKYPLPSLQRQADLMESRLRSAASFVADSVFPPLRHENLIKTPYYSSESIMVMLVPRPEKQMAKTSEKPMNLISSAAA